MIIIPPDTNCVKTYYLYVKIHNKTGLKYLGYTSNKNPHKYKGSGVRWRFHLAKHGNDYNTEILFRTESFEEIIYWGQYYSALWRIVSSDDWANLKEEAGDGGRQSPESIIKRFKSLS